MNAQEQLQKARREILGNNVINTMLDIHNRHVMETYKPIINIDVEKALEFLERMEVSRTAFDFTHFTSPSDPHPEHTMD